MIDRYTKVLLTVIAVNLTVMVGWGAAKVLVPEVMAGFDDPEQVWVQGGNITVDFVRGGEIVVERIKDIVFVLSPYK